MTELERGLFINALELASSFDTYLSAKLGFAVFGKKANLWATLNQQKVNMWLAGLLFGAMAVVVMLIPLINNSGVTVDWCRCTVRRSADRTRKSSVSLRLPDLCRRPGSVARFV